MFKTLLGYIWACIVFILEMPWKFRAVYHVCKASVGFSKKLFKIVLEAIFRDPIMLMILTALAIYTYLSEYLESIKPPV